MPTLLARRSVPSFSRNTVRPRRKNPPSIGCSACGDTADHLLVGLGCRCLDETRLYREAVRHLPGLLNRARGLRPAPVVDLAGRRRAREALEAVVGCEEQRAREQAAYRAFIRNLYANPHPRYAASRDREILDHLFGVFRRSPRIRSLEQVAETWARPVAYVRDLRDRCIEAMRHWPTETRAASASRRAV